MIRLKFALAAAVCLGAASASAQQPQVRCSPDPRNPMFTLCVDLTQGPQLKAGRTRVPSGPGSQQRPENPGYDALVDRFTTDPVKDRLKERIGLPKKFPLGKPSPGEVFCLYTEPCAAFVDASWPAETSRNATTKSRDTARLERERDDIEDALKDPSQFPTYQSACWPRSALEQRRCDVQQQLEQSWKADDQRFYQKHYDAYETTQMVERFREALRTQNLDPHMRQWAEQELMNWQSSVESYRRKGIEPYAPPAPVRLPVPPPLKGQRPERPRPSVPSVPVQRCVSSPGSSCGVQ